MHTLTVPAPESLGGPTGMEIDYRRQALDTQYLARSPQDTSGGNTSIALALQFYRLQRLSASLELLGSRHMRYPCFY